MRYKSIVLASALLAVTAYAKEPKAYLSGKILQMESVKCSVETQRLVCQEYVLQGEKTIYHIRPRDEKHPTLLPLGEQAQFRMQKEKIMLRIESVDSKEREYIVVSMTPRGESTADAAPARVNHLQ
jgi:hypothetical protein